MRVTDKNSYETYTGNLTEEQYFQVIDALLKRIPQYIINEGKPITLLSRIGRIQVMKYKPIHRRPDWFNTLKYSKLIYHENLHTDGWSVCFRWFKRRVARFRYKGLWSLDLTRFNKRKDNGKVNPNCLAEVVRREGVTKYHAL